jgi:hypothetical protein
MSLRIGEAEFLRNLIPLGWLEATSQGRIASKPL